MVLRVWLSFVGNYCECCYNIRTIHIIIILIIYAKGGNNKFGCVDFIFVCMLT